MKGRPGARVHTGVSCFRPTLMDTFFEILPLAIVSKKASNSSHIQLFCPSAFIVFSGYYMIALSFPPLYLSFVNSVKTFWGSLNSPLVYSFILLTLSLSPLCLSVSLYLSKLFFYLHKLLFFQKQAKKNWIPTLKILYIREKCCI